MYCTSRGDGELTSVIVRCVGVAPAHVTEQAKIAQLGSEGLGGGMAWGIWTCRLRYPNVHENGLA